MIFVLIFVYFTHFLGTDGRVYCRDSNATPWRKNGYSCPLRCENIVAAAQRLKTLNSVSIVEAARVSNRKPHKKIRNTNKPTNQENLVPIEDLNKKKNIKREGSRRMFNFGKGYRRRMVKIEIENIVTHQNDLPEEFNEKIRRNSFENDKVERNTFFNHFSEESNDKIERDSFVNHHTEESNDKIGRKSFLNDFPEELNNKIGRQRFGKHKKNHSESNVLHSDREDSNNYLTKEAKEDIKKLLQEELLIANETCTSLFDGYDDTMFNRILAKCALRSNFEKDLTRKVADILNRQASNFKFDSVMIMPLVKKALSTILERYGTLDVPMVLDFFEKALKGRPSSSLPQIRLKSSFCLNMYVPGCYCKAGFVESSGQCVRPLDCITDPSLIMYSEKISIVA